MPASNFVPAHDRQLAAGRKAHQAHASRVDAPFLRPRPHQADGPPGVGQGVDVDLVARPFLIGEPVLEHEPRHPLAREPLSDLVALVVDRQNAMPAPRADHDGRAGGLFLGGQEDGQRRLVNAGNPAVVPLSFALLDDLFLVTFLPSCPGAPPGQSGTTCDSSAMARPGKSNRARSSLGTIMSSVSNGKRFGVSRIGG